MDNSTLMRKTDEVSTLKEYIWELEDKARESESIKEFLMSETLKFTSKAEKIASGLQRLSHSSLTDPNMATQLSEVS